MEQEIQLTQYSKGAGCGCKIAPAALEEILKSDFLPLDSRLLVGNDTKDDAAVYDLGNGTALISTTDFFMPIVDDPIHFGRIAAANAISDVYAMGGKPILAIAILGWPIEKIQNEYARKILDGGRQICSQAGIAIAGGHSIDSPEPFFGLAVNGLVAIEHLKKNNTAKAGDWLLLTKQLGVGILSTAQKRGVLKPEHLPTMLKEMERLNDIGESLGKIKGVHAMTDITGFGLLGHTIEMAEGSKLSVELFYSQIQLLPGVADYLKDRVIPDATYRNWNCYNVKTSFASDVDVMQAFSILPDPQTNGGLLIAVDDTSLVEVQELLVQHGLGSHCEPIGRMGKQGEKMVVVKKCQ